MPNKSSDEFKQFDKVMGGLLAVPYSELQKKLEQEKKEKDKRRKPTSVKTARAKPKRGKP